MVEEHLIKIVMCVYVVLLFILETHVTNVLNLFCVMEKVLLMRPQPSAQTVIVLNPLFGAEIDVINVFLNVIHQMVLQ